MKMSVTKAGIVLAGLFLGQSAFAQTCPTSPDAWSSFNDDAPLSITTPGLAGTNCKMTTASTADDGDRARVLYNTAAPEPSFRARFFFNIEQATIDSMTTGSRIKMFNAQCQPASACPNPGIIQFKLRGDGAGGAIIRGFTRTRKQGVPGTKERFDIPVQAGENYFEVYWRIADPGQSNGFFRVWVNSCNEGSPFDLTGESNNLWEQLDNSDWNGVSRFNLGIIKANTRTQGDGWVDIPALVGDELDFDEFEARRSTFIGGCAG